MSDLQAAFNDDQDFVGLLKYTPETYLVRDGGLWIPVPGDSPTLQDVELVDVGDKFIAAFDSLDSNDMSPTYKQVRRYVPRIGEQE